MFNIAATGEWKHDPFSGDIDEDGNVWGRGTVDTKGSLFCIFTAFEELMKDGYTPDCDVYIGSGCTEEWSGDGAPKLAAYLEKQGVILSNFFLPHLNTALPPFIYGTYRRQVSYILYKSAQAA